MSAATPIASHTRPIPLTVVGGFLGAGKTTLVNAMLEQVHDRRVAVLVNDFGALAVDAALVSARGAQTISLVNGCVCCTLANGLVQALLDVLRLDPRPDHVLVEASGVGDPRRIAQIADAGRDFAPDMTVVVAAADRIATLARDRHVGDTVLRQLAAGDLIVLNKADLVSAEQAAATAAWLLQVVPGARIVRAVDARVPCDVVLGPLGAQAAGRVPRAGGEPRYVHRPADHADVFATRTLRCVRPVSETAMRRALDALPDAVLRAKGFVRFDTAPDLPRLVQVVGARRSIAPAPADVAAADSVLVLVGAAHALARADLGDIERVFAGGALSD